MKPKTYRMRFGKAPYFTLVPGLIIFLVFCILPNLATFYYALTDFNGVTVKEFVGLENFVYIFRKSEKLLNSIRISYVMAILVTVIQNVIAVLVAIFVSIKIKGNNFFRAVYFFPTAMGIFSCAMIWNIMLDGNYGPVTEFCRNISLDISFWGSKKSIYTIIALQVWMTFGYAMTIYYANIQSISSDIMEAADMDGAAFWQKIWYVILPQMLPSIRANALLSIIGALQLRDVIFLTTGGGPMESTMNLPMLIYEEAFENSRSGLGSAYQVVHFALIFISSLIVLRISKTIERKNGYDA